MRASADAVDPAHPRHAVQRRLQHGSEAVLALEEEQEVVEHEPLVDQAEAFVVVGEVVFPGGFGSHGLLFLSEASRARRFPKVPGT